MGSTSEIARAEAILLPNGQKFDEERRRFIKCLDTLDLQAVPGSGKTTALLAKLIILEHRLPFIDGSGVLVISHTNAAIDEIKGKIAKHCPKLFSHPNFVGTIQGFVDTFLAIPQFISSHGKRPVRIDNDSYHYATGKFSRCFLTGYTPDEQNYAKSYLNSNKCFATFRLHLDGVNTRLADDVSGSPLVIKKPRGRATNYNDWTDQQKNRVASWLIDFKLRIMKSGVLCFDDAYFLAHTAITCAPIIMSILRKRFRFVFVDEMQDMAKHQHDLLELLFFYLGNCQSIFQRIGDRNQAIYGGKDIAEAGVWIDRANVLTLNNSHRLSALNAKALAPFALFRNDNFQINGLNPATIKPRILVYDDSTYQHVVTRFATLIKELYDRGAISQDVPKIFKAAAWNATWNDSSIPAAGKLRLIDFCPSFERARHSKAQEFESLADYLIGIDTSHKTLSGFKKGIMNAIIRVLQLEEIFDERNERPYTVNSLLAHFRDNHPKIFLRLNLRLLQWSCALAAGEIDHPLEFLRLAIPRLLQQFGKSVSNSRSFINAPASLLSMRSTGGRREPNTLKFGNIEVNLATVHSVKGQTHTATLYLETFFNRKYESQRLASQFCGTAIASDAATQVKESSKMIFVGFSRPTHLLCFAVHKERFEQCLSAVDTSVWDIIPLYEQNGNPQS